jgi:hypothetical protein
MSTSPEADPILSFLADLRRREPRADPRLRSLALGVLTAEEAEALRLEVPDLYESHRPFDDDEHDRIFEGVLRRLACKARVAPPAWWRRRLPGVAAALGAAAVLALVLASPRPAPLELAWSEPRGGSPDPPHVSTAPGSRLVEMIVPVHPLDGPIAVRGALLLRPGGTGPGRARTWPLHVAPTRDGEIILSGTRAELFPGVESGDWDMVVIVGRPGPALDDRELRRLADGGSSGGLQVLRKRVVLDGPPVDASP